MPYTTHYKMIIKIYNENSNNTNNNKKVILKNEIMTMKNN